MTFDFNPKNLNCAPLVKIIRLLTGLIASISLFGCATEPLLVSPFLNCSEAVTVSIDCGKTPMVAFDSRQGLWAVFESNGLVYLAHSEDNGHHFSNPLAVNTIPEVIYTNGENRPKIQIGIADEIYISWNKKTEGSYTGDIRFTRSLDYGKSFSTVVTINDDGLLTGHRFDSLQVANDGTVFISWIDKRENLLGTSTTQYPSSAAIYYSTSTDRGETFSKNKKMADSTCVCCRIAMTATHLRKGEEAQIAVFWRHVFDGNIRDHAFAIIDKNGVTLPTQRATDDNWAIEACPHHGPAITQDTNGAFQLVWFTAGETRKGIYYGQYDPVNQTMKNLFAVSNLASASHPSIINNGKFLLIVWKEFDGEKTLVYQIKSRDKGISWEKASIISTTKDGSDHPLLTLSGEDIWLSWHSNNEGLRLFLLN